MTQEESTLNEIRKHIATQSEDDRIRIEAIARTLRNIITADEHAGLAFALVGAEMAAAE